MRGFFAFKILVEFGISSKKETDKAVLIGNSNLKYSSLSRFLIVLLDVTNLQIRAVADSLRKSNITISGKSHRIANGQDCCVEKFCISLSISYVRLYYVRCR